MSVKRSHSSMRRMAFRQARSPRMISGQLGAQRANAADASDDDAASSAQPSVDRHHLPRHVRCIGGHQETRPQPPLPRRCRRAAPESPRRISSIGTCSSTISVVDQAGRDAVDRDLPLGELDRQRLGRADDAGLRGAVVDLAAVAHHARHRRQRHDPPRRPPTNHRHDHRLQHVVEGVEVGAAARRPIARRSSPERRASECSPALQTTP